MTRKTKNKASDRITLALRLADGSFLPVEAGVNSLRFIGRYSRVSAFGPLGTRITAHLVARD